MSRAWVLTAKSLTAAARGICYATAYAADEAHMARDPSAREAAEARASFLTPIAKAFSTDIGVEVSSLAIQVHGGMGYIEETGVAQLWRDSRIAPIYEGTNGIQAIDLVTRKLPSLGGATERALLADVAATADALARAPDVAVRDIAPQLSAAAKAMAEAGAYLKEALGSRPCDSLGGAAAYLRLAGLTLGGQALAKGALAAGGAGVSPAFTAGESAAGGLLCEPPPSRNRRAQDGHPGGRYICRTARSGRACALNQGLSIWRGSVAAAPIVPRAPIFR